jgi:hypothetical protein
MATTGSDEPLPPAEAVAVFDRFKANLARLSAQNKEQLAETRERVETLQAKAQADLLRHQAKRKPAT